jgi:hypothetical protein
MYSRWEGSSFLSRNIWIMPILYEIIFQNFMVRSCSLSLRVKITMNTTKSLSVMIFNHINTMLELIVEIWRVIIVACTIANVHNFSYFLFFEWVETESLGTYIWPIVSSLDENIQRKKTWLSATFSTTNSMWNYLGLNPDQRSEKPTTKVGLGNNTGCIILRVGNLAD